MSHIYFSSLGGEVAQWLAHKPVELGVAGSSPVFLATLKHKNSYLTNQVAVFLLAKILLVPVRPAHRFVR